MQIKRLELAGFKSFMNPVQLDFGGGITAILGPNGCGKSNVVDSIRWVLGEQSAKQLRGDKMMNVVFGGTRLRKALGMSEVSITFSNAQGRMPVPFQEVRITRRLSRDGVSEYLLNGAPCRLKDIKDLITDTGAGSHAYSIIEREMVDGVINGHEDSRRFLFEEASGIMKYRMRRKEALRKLELTEQDLLRLNDIIDEIERQVRALKRQMGRARRYQELQSRLRRAETWAAQRKLHEYRDETAALQSQLDGLQAEGVGGDAESDAIGARIAALRTEQVDIERDYRLAAETCEALAAQLKQSEETILILGGKSESTRDSRAAATAEVATTEVRLEHVRQNRAELESQRVEFESRLEAERQTFIARKEELATCESRHEGARTELLQVKQRSIDFAQDQAARRTELELLRAKLETQEKRAAELRESLRQDAERAARLAEEQRVLTAQIELLERGRETRRANCAVVEARQFTGTAELETLRDTRAELGTRLEALRTKHDMLRAMAEAYEGYGEGARALLARHAGSELVLGTLAEHVRAPRGLERAFDALLHDVLDALLVRDVDGAVDLLQELRGAELGRATLVPPRTPGVASSVAPGDASWQRARSLPGVVGVAADLVPAGGRGAEALHRFLCRALVVEDVVAARAVLDACDDPALRVATRDGVLFTGAGAVHGGSSAEPDASLLGRRQRLDEQKSELEALARRVEAERDRAMHLEAELQACGAERRELESGLRADDARHHELSLGRMALETSLGEIAERRSQAEELLAQVQAEVSALASRLPGLAQAAESLTRQGDLHHRTVADLESAFATLDQERERLRHEAGEQRVAYVTLQGEAESRLRQLERLAELEVELADLCTRRRDEIARADHDLERYAAELAAARLRAGESAENLERARAAQNEVGLRLDSQRSALDAEQQRLHEIEKGRREQQGRRHAAEMGLSEIRMRQQNLLERMQEHYQLDEAQLAGLVFDWTDDEPLPDEARVRELRDEIGRIGPVNLLALEEFEEKSARLHFLEEQRDDLTRASASLGETIEKINRTAHFLFMETFEQIRAHFLETIRTVFDGGDGDLVLTNPEDPLDTDIEILVRPRGKKIDTLTQLSSGERALTAIALLFSIYLVKPSPFCVFDEVDAPLDDANIGRFVNLLHEFKERTQFVVITHNKLTMEAADRLYGVTMEEEGVSKLVSVALDGELKGVPRPLQSRAKRSVRAAAVLTPVAGTVGGAPLDLVSLVDSEHGRAAARLDRETGNGGGNGHGHGDEAAVDAGADETQGGGGDHARDEQEENGSDRALERPAELEPLV